MLAGMRTLRYGASATWLFNGFDLPVGEVVDNAVLTIADAFPTETEEQPDPAAILLQKAVTATLDADGQVTQPNDGDGNWSLFFNLSAVETQTDLTPPPRYLWYEVTLETLPGTLILRPFVGQIRMLGDLFAP